MDNTMKKIVHIFIIIFITALIVTIIALLILKYNIEGENNMPFELSKIMVVSSAEGIDNTEENENRWNLNIVQNNDIYLEITKNKNYKDTEIIDEIIIDNFNFIQFPKKGENILYRPTDKEGIIYENKEEYKIENSLIYKGGEESSIKKLQIANQGGLILFRYTVNNLGTYTTDENEIRHDGTLLSKINLNYEDIKTKISFDFSVKLKSDKIYTGNIELNFPAENIMEEGTSSYEKNNLKDIIFKRNLR